MNRLQTLATVAFSWAAFGVATAQEEGLVPIETLPGKAQSFIGQYFSESSIVSVWQDIDGGRVSDYTVLLADGTEVEFRANGEWEEVKSRNGAVSAKIVPAKISKYVRKHYPTALVKEIQKKLSKYEVKLSNGLELIFNTRGKFVKVDD
jgi:hypothetical protein